VDETPAYATIREGMALREQGRPSEAKALMEALIAEVEGGNDAYLKVFLAHSRRNSPDRPRHRIS
jgi:hypothetical protein